MTEVIWRDAKAVITHGESKRDEWAHWLPVGSEVGPQVLKKGKAKGL